MRDPDPISPLEPPERASAELVTVGDVDGEPIRAEVFVSGRPFGLTTPPPECAHLAFTQQVTVANIVDPDTREHLKWAVKLKVRCAECGIPCRFDVATAQLSELDGDRALVCEVVPLSEADRTDADVWPAIGDAADAPMVPAPRQPFGLISGS